MKQIFKLFILFCFSAIIVSGCSANDAKQKPLCRVVTQVDISCQQEDVLIQRHYTDNQKMESVLLYLRLLKPLGKPETDPETVDADVYEVTVCLSDGQKRIYRQKGHRYLAKGISPWQAIDPEQAAGLYALMRQFPSDAPSSTAAI